MLFRSGVIFAMIPQQPQLAYQLSKYLPVVAIGDRRSDLELATVDMNNFTAGQLIGKHLTDLGHKHVAYLSTTLNDQHTSRVRRYQGLEDACKDDQYADKDVDSAADDHASGAAEAAPATQEDDLDEYAKWAAEAAAKATSGEFPASAPAAPKPAPRKPIPMPMPSALKPKKS